ETTEGWRMDPHASGQDAHLSPGPPFQWLSFAYQGLTEIPYDTILKQTDSLEVLDLSFNLLEDLYWNPALLGQLERLSTFPYMPSVTTVCINKNKINNLPVFVEEVRRKFPNINFDREVVNNHIPSFTSAICLMFGSYYCFNIHYLVKLQSTLEFLQREKLISLSLLKLQIVPSIPCMQ
uniref:Uncharacterized protein n=1 Tax=Cynoglossus semilaevis TaxID=244447 RepID=A0A3P8WST0_CYNSE